MKLESFNNNLYIPRNVEGEPNRELLDITRAMEETLQQNESFVGLAPFGSWMSGYSNEKSDIDLYVLYDSVHQSRVAFESFLNTVEKELEAARGRRIHCKAFDVNPDLVIADIPRDVDGCNPYVHRIQAMTRIVTGKKIDHYRGELAQKLHRLTPAEQQAVSNDTFRSLSNSDAESFGKRKKRMFDFSEEERSGMTSAQLQRILPVNRTA